MKYVNIHAFLKIAKSAKISSNKSSQYNAITLKFSVKLELKLRKSPLYGTMCKNDCEPIQTENAYAMHKKCIYLRKLKNECQPLSWLKDSLRGTPLFATNFCTGPVGWKYASTLRDATFRCFIKTVYLLDQKKSASLYPRKWLS